MVYFVRNGQTEWDELDMVSGHKDIMLNDNGINQACNLSDILSLCNIERIISSDLKRARQTAEIINSKICKDIVLDSRLRGYNYGVLEGYFRGKIESSTWYILKKYPDILSAESNIEIYDRIKSFFEQTDLSNNTIVVTHGGTLRMILYYLENKNHYDDKLYKKNYQKNDICHGQYIMFDGENVIYPKINIKSLH